MLLKFKKKVILSLFILVLLTNFVSAVTDEDVRIALKKALYEYFENPDTATLTLNQIRDLIDLYLNTPPGTDPVDLSGVAINSGTTIDIVYNKAAAITTLIPTCSDGTEYGECSTINKPNYCSNGNIISNCGGYDGCGCPAGQTCQADDTCIVPTCTDGTAQNTCSSSQPLYCDAILTLVDDCSTCSCPAGQICQVDGLCTITLPQPASLGNIPEDAAIIFWSTRNIQGAQVLFPSNLYTMSIDGSKITQITFEQKGFTHAAVSPNHKYIVAASLYEKNNEQRDGVWLFDLEMKTEQQLLPNFYQVGVGGVDWLGNEWIYMQAREQKPLQPEDIGKSYIYKIRPDGTGLTRITNDDAVFETDVSVSEDGTLIAFVANIQTTDAQGNLCYDPQIWTAIADGSNIQIIDVSGLPCGVQGTDAIGNFDPEISQDNKFVVFSRTNTQVPKNFKDTLNTAHDIWIAPLDKSSPAQQITPQGAISIIPDWHSDKILYTVYYESIDELNNYTGLATINADGTNEQRLEPSYANIWDGGRHGKWIHLVSSTSTTKWTNFANPQLITIVGYTGHAMEPGISKDGNLLFFNNNTITGDENLLWAVKIDDTTFQYMGEVGNVNNFNVVDGTPSMDMIGSLYYTSLVSYGADSKSLYSGAFNVVNGVGSVANPQVLEGNIYEGISPWASVDIDVSPTGNTIYYAEGKFDTAPPSSFNVRVANKNVEGKYIRDDSILTNINTNDREYAPSISFDGKELFFTRSKGVPPNPITAEIFIAKRDSISEPFGIPVKIDAITGFVEGPTITADGKILYYHKDDGGVFKIYKATRQQYKINNDWQNQRKVTVLGFDKGAEIGVSKDESMLFFNNPSGNKNLHWATRIDDTTYQYQGEMQNVNTNAVDASPVMDTNGKIYYTQTINYPQDLKTMFVANFVSGAIVNPQPLTGDIYNSPVPYVSLDTAVSPNADTIYYSEFFDSDFSTPFPDESNIRMATRVSGNEYQQINGLLDNINTNDLEYAPSISANGLELYFTRALKSQVAGGNPPTTEGGSGIFVAKRSNVNEPFGIPEQISAITGTLVEAPTITEDGQTIYFHKFDGVEIRAYKVSRK